MSLRILVALLFAACAGPAVHRTPTTNESEGARLAVATTLSPENPLDAPNCGLPTGGEACAEPGPSEQKADEHHHHHHGAAPEAPAPAPAPAPEPPAKPKKEEHRHQHPAPSSAAPIKAAPTGTEVTSVRDPVCGMTINPATAKGGTATLHGKQHWFCSTSCRRTFLSQNPEAK
jgi:YHS domain-containing protein